MDEDSGGSQPSMPKRDGRARHQLDDKSPSGGPNPLPRRSAQRHLEPQLRHPGGSGTGTPFAAFAAKDDAAGAEAAKKAAANNAAAQNGAGSDGAGKNDAAGYDAGNNDAPGHDAGKNGGAGKNGAANSAGKNGAAGHGAGEDDTGDGDAGGPVSGVADRTADTAETSRAADFRRGARRGHTPRPATPAN